MTTESKSIEKSARSTTRKKAVKVISIKPKKPFKTYEQALEYLCTRTDYEREKNARYNVTNFNLERMHDLLKLVGDPHTKFQSAHVAGTKGKGSTCTMLARMLEANGLKVGLYTSPHLMHMHERITINGQNITDEQMLGLMNRLHGPVESVSKEQAPSFFELMTVLAFMFFAEEQVDFAVVETGMGGRLDCTNVIMPKVIGITSLSMDHMDQLGNTIEKIAAEKAGIFKKGVPVVTVKQNPEALKVLRAQAAAQDTTLLVTGKDMNFSYRFETSRQDGPHMRICLTTPTSKFEHLRVPLHGKHQAINCGLALAMLDKLRAIGFNVDTEKAIEGLSKVQMQGRMEMISYDPRIMIDAAHNADSIQSLMIALGQNIPYDSMVVIFGCNVDKDIHGMLTQLQFGADKVIFTRSSSVKAASPDELAETYTEICGKMCQTAPSLGMALELAASAVGREDLICITGSFYLIGQAKLRFKKVVHSA